jgi:UDP-2,3-diacylglucosamine hydrolase
MAVLFVGDVHLSTERPERLAAFLGFLQGDARRAEALYLLGDVFDQWLGDDDPAPPHPEVLEALAALTGAGVPVLALHGNHDFLLGEGFVSTTGCRLLPDLSVVEVYGESVLVTHGDVLCTDDVEYQAWRAYSRDPVTQRAFLALPLAARQARAAEIRARSRASTRLKPQDIMDVNPTAVRETMKGRGVRLLVHGHTHRPGVYPVDPVGTGGWRIVVGDWYEEDSVLVWDASGYRLARVAEL